MGSDDALVLDVCCVQPRRDAMLGWSAQRKDIARELKLVIDSKYWTADMSVTDFAVEIGESFQAGARVARFSDRGAAGRNCDRFLGDFHHE